MILKENRMFYLEQIHSEVRTIAEGHSGIARDINDIKDILDEHKIRFDRIEMVVSENRKDIKELKTDVSQLKAGYEDLKAGQEELNANVKRVEQKLDTVTSDHEERIQKLETVR